MLSIKTQSSKGSLGCFLHFHILIWETYIQMCFHLSEEPAFPWGLYFSVSISTSGKQVLCSRISLPSLFFFHLFFLVSSEPPCCIYQGISEMHNCFPAPFPHNEFSFLLPSCILQTPSLCSSTHFKRMRLPGPLLTPLQLFHTSLRPRGSHIAQWCCNHCCPPQTKMFHPGFAKISISKKNQKSS